MKREFLEEHVFYGLKNRNTGFDSEQINYFSEEDFKIVLERIEQLGLGIFGIEPWKDEWLYDVLSYEDFDKEPTDPLWYNKAFTIFKQREKELLYSASYYFPEDFPGLNS